MPSQPDVIITGHGSIYLLHLQTVSAEWWVNEHIVGDHQIWAGALVVEHRFAGDVVAGMLEDGLEVR